MITHDFYKLMELPRHADVQLIKRTYYKLALKYHPDKNPDDVHAEEFFKTVTQGYHVLSNPVLKAEYDEILESYYTNKQLTRERSVRYHARNYSEVSEKVKAIKELRREQLINDFIHKQRVFPLGYRYILACLILLSGVLMTYNHWFIDESVGVDYIYIVAGFLIYAGGVYLLSNYLYQHLAFIQARKSLAYSPGERLSSGVFVGLFFLGPLLMVFLTYRVKAYHLSHYRAEAIPSVVTISNNKIYYKYTVNHHTYQKSSEIPDNAFNRKAHHYKVYFSTENPKIAELVRIENQ